MHFFIFLFVITYLFFVPNLSAFQRDSQECIENIPLMENKPVKEVQEKFKEVFFEEDLIQVWKSKWSEVLESLYVIDLLTITHTTDWFLYPKERRAFELFLSDTTDLLMDSSSWNKQLSYLKKGSQRKSVSRYLKKVFSLTELEKRKLEIDFLNRFFLEKKHDAESFFVMSCDGRNKQDKVVIFFHSLVALESLLNEKKEQFNDTLFKLALLEEKEAAKGDLKLQIGKMKLSSDNTVQKDEQAVQTLQKGIFLNEDFLGKEDFLLQSLQNKRNQLSSLNGEEKVHQESLSQEQTNLFVSKGFELFYLMRKGIRSLNTSIEDKKNQIKDLKDQVEQLRVEGKRISDDERLSLADKEKKLQELSFQFEEKHKKIKELEKQLESTCSEYENQVVELNSYEKKHNDLIQRINIIKWKLNLISKKRKDLDQRVALDEEELKRHREKIAADPDCVNRLKKQIDHSKKQIDSLLSVIEEKRAPFYLQIQELQEQIQQIDSEEKDLLDQNFLVKEAVEKLFLLEGQSPHLAMKYFIAKLSCPDHQFKKKLSEKMPMMKNSFLRGIRGFFVGIVNGTANFFQ